MKPWHLHSEAERDRVLTCLDVEADWQIHHYQAHNRDYSDALRAAAAVLRNAAPWPDEALVVAGYVYQDEGRHQLEIVDVDSIGCLCVVDAYGDEHWRKPESCDPLTPAAAEFLAAMGGGE